MLYERPLRLPEVKKTIGILKIYELGLITKGLLHHPNGLPPRRGTKTLANIRYIVQYLALFK